MKKHTYAFATLSAFLALTFSLLSMGGDETQEIRQDLVREALFEDDTFDYNALFSASMTGNTSAKKPVKKTKRSWISCIDSDGGVRPSVRGTVSLAYTLSNGKKKMRNISDVNITHKEKKGIAEFFCLNEKTPKVKFFECETKSRGVCGEFRENTKEVFALSSGVSENTNEYHEKINFSPEGEYISVFTPLYYKVVITNTGESAGETFVTLSLEGDSEVFGDVKNEKIICPSGAVCEGDVTDEKGISISNIFPGEEVVITYERDVSGNKELYSGGEISTEKYQLDSGESTMSIVELQK